MRGHEPPGYDVQGRKPVVNEAKAVRQTFLRFIDLGCAAGLARDLRRKGFHGKQGTWDRACHRAGKPPQAGQQQPCADASAAQGADPWRKWRDHDADLHKERGQLYRGHVPMDVIRTRETGEKTAPPRLATGRVKGAAETEVRRILQTPEVVTRVLAALKRNSAGAFRGGCHRGPARGRCALPTTLGARTGPIIQSLARRVVGQQRRARPRQSARRGRGHHPRDGGPASDEGGRRPRSPVSRRHESGFPPPPGRSHHHRQAIRTAIRQDVAHGNQ